MTSTIACSLCGSKGVTTHNYGRKSGGAMGAIAGAAGSVAAALSMSGNGNGSEVGRIAGMVLGALLGGAAGCKTGALLGGAIDEHVLDNYECVNCGHIFSVYSTRGR